MNIITFINNIKLYLKTKCDRVYFHKAPSNVPFPYLVFDLPSSFNTSPSEDFTLEVDAWDDKQDTVTLETLVESIDGNGDFINPTGLNNRTITAPNLTATFHRESRGTIPDEDVRINRRQLRYRVRAY